MHPNKASGRVQDDTDTVKRTRRQSLRPPSSFIPSESFGFLFDFLEPPMVLHCFSAGKVTPAPDKTSFRELAGSKPKPAPWIVSTAILARAANTSHPSPRTAPSTCLTRAFRLSRVISPTGQNKEKGGHACSPQELCRAQLTGNFKLRLREHGRPLQETCWGHSPRKNATHATPTGHYLHWCPRRKTRAR